MTNCVFLTDTHVDRPWPDNRQETALTAFAEEMESVRPDILFHGGDVFNKKSPTSSGTEFMTQWLTKLSKCCQQIILLPGGHDQDAPRGTTAIDFVDDLAPNITIIYEPVDLDGMVMMPYQRRLTPENLAMIANAEIAILHQGVDSAPRDNGTKYGNIPDAVPLACFQNTRLALIGHIHTPWTNGTNVHLVGSPYQTRWDHQAVQRNYVMFDLEDPTTVNYMPFPGTFYLQDVTLSIHPEITMEEFISILPGWRDSTYVRVKIGVEGVISNATRRLIEQAVKTTYGGWLDDLHVLSVLSSAERTVQNDIVLAMHGKAEMKAPGEWLDFWMDRRGGAYFRSHKAVVDQMHIELEEIVGLSEK